MERLRRGLDGAGVQRRWHREVAGAVTVFHNGVLVQNNFALKGGTAYIGQPSYKAHGPSAIKLQSHGDPSPPISFRNIWIRELP